MPQGPETPRKLAMLAPSATSPRRVLPRVLSAALLASLVLAGLGIVDLSRPAIGKQPEAAKKVAGEKATGEKATDEKATSETAASEEATGETSGNANAGSSQVDRVAIEELRDIAEHAYEEALGFYDAGDAYAQEVHHWSRVWLDLDLMLAPDDEKKIVSTQAHLDRMTNLANAGLWRARELEYYVAEAELVLNRLKPNPDFAATIAARRALEGEWDVVSIEEDGGASPKPDIKSITVVGRRATFEHRLGTAKALLVLDVSTKPASIDILGLNEDFPFGGQGIYKLEGETLTLCWGTGAVRPTEFVTKPGDSVILCVLKRPGAK